MKRTSASQPLPHLAQGSLLVQLPLIAAVRVPSAERVKSSKPVAWFKNTNDQNTK